MEIKIIWKFVCYFILLFLWSFSFSNKKKKGTKFVRNLDIRPTHSSNIDSVRSIIHASRLRIRETFQTKTHFPFLKNKRWIYRMIYKWWEILIHLFIAVTMKNNVLHGIEWYYFFFYVTRKIHVKIVNVFFFLMGSYILSVKKIKNTQNDLSTIPVPYLSYLVNFINFKSYIKQFLIININI